jgi:hypothetical protein
MDGAYKRRTRARSQTVCPMTGSSISRRDYFERLMHYKQR